MAYTLAQQVCTDEIPLGAGEGKNCSWLKSNALIAYIAHAQPLVPFLDDDELGRGILGKEQQIQRVAIGSWGGAESCGRKQQGASREEKKESENGFHVVFG